MTADTDTETHDRYADVTVVWAGAVDSDETVYTDTELGVIVAHVMEDVASSNDPVEVYVLWHEHGLMEDECSCAQYVTDGRPAYSWNTED